MKYKFLEHKADAKFQAFGKNLNEAFSNAALAMFSIMVNTKKIEGRTKKEIKVKGKDKKSLLYNFLEELLFLLDTEHFLLHKIEKLEIKNNELKAKIIGDKISKKYEILGEVKAVTYNQMEIKEKPYMVQVVVDL